ncbi:MAG: DNA replication and repair protein RecF, partial [Candidatus Neomarinimicrobiota bacterium]
ILLSLEDLELTYGPPSFRRKFIDILISQIDPIYLQSLKQLLKILKHRNKLLTLIKEGSQKETSLLPWDLQLAKFASYVCLKRREVINEFNSLLENYYKQMASTDEIVKIQYQTFFDSGLQQEEEIKNYYLQKLTEIKERDIAYGSTTIGAHRDDLLFFKNNAPIKIFGSQGENKTFLISLKFAEANLIKNKVNEEPILLLDDIFSELDMSRIQKVIEYIRELNFQTFITTTDVQKFDSQLNDVSLWFVSNGQVSIES